MKKYALTNETIQHENKTLYRIIALQSFGDVKVGNLGGFIEKEDNLSQNGNCWVYGDAKVYGNAHVCQEALVFDNAQVFDNAFINANAYVCGKAKVYGEAHVYGNTHICGEAQVYGKARVYEHALIYGKARVCDKAIVNGSAKIMGDAIIKKLDDYIVFKNFWSSGARFTWTKSNNMWQVGLFYGTGDELIERSYKDSQVSGDNYKRVVEYVKSCFPTEK